MATLSDCDISRFYDGRSIFITGGTGFMGKVLVEKLLRSCPGVERIYLLMRPSKGKDVTTRIKELVHNQVFDRVKSAAMEKLVAVEGDVSLPGFGMSSQDLQIIIDEVSIAFHSAATVRFDEDLKTALNLNVKGPRNMLNVCRQMKQLKALVHVSTAYIKLDKYEVVEVIYPTRIDPLKLNDFIDCISDDQLVEALTKGLLGSYPNTYTFTKALAEQLLEREKGQIPLAIVRPSIVLAALKEPVPGWIDNMNGPTAAMVGVGKGVIRTIKGNGDMIGDIIPVDLAINLTIAVAWATATNSNSSGSGEIKVYNSSTSHQNPLLWGSFCSKITEEWTRNPSRGTMWYPSLVTFAGEVPFKLSWLILHLLPAFALDTIGFLFNGQKTKWVRLYGRIWRGMRVVQFFTMNEWRFVSRRSKDLLEMMTGKDREVFNFDVRLIDWDDWVKSYVAGMRRFILRESPDTIPQARASLQRFYLLKILLWAVLLVAILVFGAFQFLQDDPTLVPHNGWPEGSVGSRSPPIVT